MFISLSFWVIPVDISVEWPKTKIWGWGKGFYAVHLYLHL